MKEITPSEIKRRAAISAWWQNPQRIKKRFWRKVQKRGPGECWLWLAWKNNKGYGCFRFRGKDTSASRVAYILTFGEICESLEVCHKCDNPACCNPAHLFPGTHKDNMHDCIAKGRKVVPRGEQISTKLTEEIVLSIRAEVTAGVRQSVLAARYGIGRTYLCDIVHRRFWTHI